MVNFESSSLHSEISLLAACTIVAFRTNDVLDEFISRSMLSWIPWIESLKSDRILWIWRTTSFTWEVLAANSLMFSLDRCRKIRPTKIVQLLTYSMSYLRSSIFFEFLRPFCHRLLNVLLEYFLDSAIAL